MGISIGIILIIYPFTRKPQKVISSGPLISNINNFNMSIFYTNYHQQKNLKAHQTDPKWGSNSNYIFSLVSGKSLPLEFFIKLFKPKSILDYGCGKGHALNQNKLKFPDIEMVNYDPFNPLYSEVPTQPCDLVICYNVLQVIEAQFLDAAVEHIMSLSSKNVLISINCDEDTQRGWRNKDGWRTVLEKNNIIAECSLPMTNVYPISGAPTSSSRCQFWISKDSK
jgi:hypothetical protein